MKIKIIGGSPAERAGLIAGDTVIKINNTEVYNLRHKDAQDVILRAGPSFDVTIQRGGSTWKPSVAPVGTISSPRPTSSVNNVSPITTTSLAARRQESIGAIGTGHNVSAKPFHQINGGPKLANKQYNSPIPIYSDQSIAETLSAQTEVLANGVLGVNFKKNEKCYNSTNSEVFRMVQEAEKEPRDYEQVSRSDFYATHSHAIGGQTTALRTTPIEQYQSLNRKGTDLQQSEPAQASVVNQQITKCSDCDRVIVGVFVRIKDKNLHVDCFKCSTCGSSLKNVGYYNLNNKLYCDVHAKLAARNNPPAPNLQPITVPPCGKIPSGTISAALTSHSLPSPSSLSPNTNYSAAPYQPSTNFSSPRPFSSVSAPLSPSSHTPKLSPVTTPFTEKSGIQSIVWPPISNEPEFPTASPLYFPPPSQVLLCHKEIEDQKQRSQNSSEFQLNNKEEMNRINQCLTEVCSKIERNATECSEIISDSIDTQILVDSIVQTQSKSPPPIAQKQGNSVISSSGDVNVSFTISEAELKQGVYQNINQVYRETSEVKESKACLKDTQALTLASMYEKKMKVENTVPHKWESQMLTALTVASDKPYTHLVDNEQKEENNKTILEMPAKKSCTALGAALSVAPAEPFTPVAHLILEPVPLPEETVPYFPPEHPITPKPKDDKNEPPPKPNKIKSFNKKKTDDKDDLFKDLPTPPTERITMLSALTTASDRSYSPLTVGAVTYTTNSNDEFISNKQCSEKIEKQKVKQEIKTKTLENHETDKMSMTPMIRSYVTAPTTTLFNIKTTDSSKSLNASETEKKTTINAQDFESSATSETIKNIQSSKNVIDVAKGLPPMIQLVRSTFETGTDKVQMEMECQFLGDASRQIIEKHSTTDISEQKAVEKVESKKHKEIIKSFNKDKVSQHNKASTVINKKEESGRNDFLHNTEGAMLQKVTGQTKSCVQEFNKTYSQDFQHYQQNNFKECITVPVPDQQNLTVPKISFQPVTDEPVKNTTFSHRPRSLTPSMINHPAPTIPYYQSSLVASECNPADTNIFDPTSPAISRSPSPCPFRSSSPFATPASKLQPVSAARGPPPNPLSSKTTLQDIRREGEIKDARTHVQNFIPQHQGKANTLSYENYAAASQKSETISGACSTNISTISKGTLKQAHVSEKVEDNSIHRDGQTQVQKKIHVTEEFERTRKLKTTETQKFSNTSQKVHVISENQSSVGFHVTNPQPLKSPFIGTAEKELSVEAFNVNTQSKIPIKIQENSHPKPSKVIIPISSVPSATSLSKKTTTKPCVSQPDVGTSGGRQAGAIGVAPKRGRVTFDADFLNQKLKEKREKEEEETKGTYYSEIKITIPSSNVESFNERSLTPILIENIKYLNTSGKVDKFSDKTNCVHFNTDDLPICKSRIKGSNVHSLIPSSNPKNKLLTISESSVDGKEDNQTNGVHTCNVCRTKETRGPFITALGKIWCPDHFICTTPSCRRPLHDLGFVEERGQLYCEYCFEQYLAPPCSKCNAKIKGDCLKAIGRNFHPECFNCVYCGKLFGNSPFFLEDAQPYCEADWNELFTTKCFACGFPVEAGDRWVEALSNNYHSQCFNCTFCLNLNPRVEVLSGDYFGNLLIGFDDANEVMEDVEKSYYKLDTKLELSNKDFGKLLNTSQFDINAALRIPFPNDYVLARFSQLAYDNTFNNLFEDWHLLTKASNPKRLNGYFGVSFWNPKLCQVVIAHRGTRVSNVGALLTDSALALKYDKTKQAESATTFVYLVAQEIRNCKNDDNIIFQLSITGHSLGAWLAQMTSFTLKYFKLKNDTFIEDKNYTSNIHAHTVVFESPGCKDNLDNLYKKFVPSYIKRRFGDYNVLDMTEYLSEANFINSVNKHVGTVYKLHSTTHNIQDVVDQFDPSTGVAEKELVLDSKTGFFASFKSMFKFFRRVDYNKTTASSDQYSLNVFNENELEFIKDWNHINDFYPDLIRQIKQPLSRFKVDYEYNLIKSSNGNINTVIAQIKHFPRSKSFAFDLLKTVEGIKLNYEMFKMKSAQFTESLVRCTDDYFVKDKYGLKDFLLSDKGILHICIKSDLNHQSRVECSILSNVCKFYAMQEVEYIRSNQYYFISWIALSTIFRRQPQLFNNCDLTLLIIECGEFDNEDFEDLQQFVTQVSFKIVLLSVEEVIGKDKHSTLNTEGFSHNIVFEDLIEESQKQLITQRRIIFDNRKISFGDLLDEQFPFSEVAYNRLNKALPTNLLLYILTTPTFEYLEISPCYKNILNGVTIEVFKPVDLNTIRSNYADKRLFLINADESNSNDLLQSLPPYFYQSANFEKECLDNLYKIIYSFVARDDKIFLDKVFRLDLYMNRKIFHPRSVNPSIFNDPAMAFDMFYICGNRAHFDDYLKSNNSDGFLYLSEEQAKQEIREFKIHTHILRIEDDKTIRWLLSTGNINTVKNYLPKENFSKAKLNRDILIEEELCNENIIIISGEPGMGKTSLLKKLYLYVQKTHWVFWISLIYANFEKLDPKDYNSIAQFLLNATNINGDYVQFLLSYSLQHPIKIPLHLMFDGFDEIINADCRKKFVQLVNTIKYNSNIKIIITTRNYLCRVLENGISVPASYLFPIDTTISFINYLKIFWSSKLEIFEDLDVELLQEFATSLLSLAPNFLGDSTSMFLGIPLHIRILAEIMTPTILRSNPENIFSDCIVPYRKLVEIRCSTYLSRCNFPNNANLKEFTLIGIFEKLYKLAIIQLFRYDMEFIFEKDLEEFDKIGLIVSNSDHLHFSFLHDSVRDYLIATIVSIWLEGKLVCCEWEIDDLLIRYFVIDPQFKEIRMFLNCYLKNNIVSPNSMMICRARLHKIHDENKHLLFNNDETFYHICIKEDLWYLLHNLLILIAEDDIVTMLLFKRDANQKTALFLAIERNSDDKIDENGAISLFLGKMNKLPSESIKSVLLSSFITNFASTKQLDLIDSFAVFTNVQDVLPKIRTAVEKICDFLVACLRNKSKIIIKILNLCDDLLIKRYMASVTNERKQTGLHLTISKTIISTMLEYGADINGRDYCGRTPLIRAIKKEKVEVINLIISKGANVAIADFHKTSVLSHATKHGLEEIVEFLINSKAIDVNSCNIFGITSLMLASRNGNVNIIKMLLNAGAFVNAVDDTGLSAFYHCIKSNNQHLIQILNQRGADIDIRDVYGITPLLYSIKKSNWNVTNRLLDIGANPNICSYNGDYPIKLLIQKERTNILKKILTKTFRNITISDIESINILESDEKAYIFRHILKLEKAPR
ncbi:hypothetical protein FQA39_LY12392 [Lamprigera yunnana]|nr:hypothetical protein FQA39_LY12392 [Lamprigera yunnana]